MIYNRERHSISTLIFIFAALLAFSSFGFSQTADDYFELGKTDLANSSLTSAHSNFQNALSLDPNHQGANLFCAITTVLMVSNSSSFNTLLDRAGVSASGRDIFNWNADFARDAYGNVLLPDNAPTGNELQNYAKDELLPVIVEAINRMDKVGSGFQTHFKWALETGWGYASGATTFQTYSGSWSPNEWVGYKLLIEGAEYTIISNTTDVLTVSPNLNLPMNDYDYAIVGPVEIDYGDVLVMRGGLNLAKAGIRIFASYDFNADIDAIVSLMETPGFNIQTNFLQAYPQILTLLPAHQLATAKAEIGEGITQLLAAVDFITNESDPQGNDFFLLSPEDSAEFSATLQQCNNALAGPTFIDSLKTQVDLTQFFDDPQDLRKYLPVFKYYRIRMDYYGDTWFRKGFWIKRGSFPDRTFGGIFPSMTEAEWYRLLAEVWAPEGVINFHGGGYSDLTVWRPGSGIWYALWGSYSYGDDYWATNWGIQSDQPIQEDYDGDGVTDISVWRPGTGIWYLLKSSIPGSYASTQWGVSSDKTVQGDYDRDGKADIAVWRPETGIWYVLPSSTPGKFTTTQWGMVGDIPVPADYDGDGKTDYAIWRPGSGIWYVLPSSEPGNYIARQWGIHSDTPVPGDYDGDGKTDIAVWRSGMWYILPSSEPQTFWATQWGQAGDVPVVANCDRYDKSDIGVWRPGGGMWYILPSGWGGYYLQTQWGSPTDVPISPLTGVLRSVP
jgi:hypothetical protein